MTKTGLVVSAHSADFVWRAAGAIAMGDCHRRLGERQRPEHFAEIRAEPKERIEDKEARHGQRTGQHDQQRHLQPRVNHLKRAITIKGVPDLLEALALARA